jgi:GTP cyclohydrolase II
MTDAIDPLVPPAPEMAFAAATAAERTGAGAIGTAVGPFRQVHRAIAELRRGVPVIVGGEVPLVVLAAEGASMAGLREMAALTGGEGSLVLAGRRAADISGRSVRDEALLAFALPGRGLDADRIRGVADPTVEQLAADPLVEVPLPPLADAGLLLAKLARLLPAVVAAPLAAPGGAEAGGLVHVPASDVLHYPMASASRLVRVAEAQVPLEDAADARLVAFRSPDAGIEHLALLVGRPEACEAPLVRLHSECFTGDFLGSVRCDCGPQLRQAIRRMAAEGAGVLLYLAQEGRGIGLVNKLRAYALQDRGLDTLDANLALGWGVDERSFLAAATMLEALGVPRVRLLTNNPAKVAALQACGIAVVARLSHAIAPNGVNDGYLATKAQRLGHLFG